MDTKRFYDVHFHIMDLSHINMTAYIKRLFGLQEILKSVGSFFVNIPINLFYFIKGIFSKNKESRPSIDKTRNLLAFMENSIRYDFLVVDYFLKNKDSFVSKNNEFKIGDKTYNKIVLCPLVMDFGYKSLNNNKIFYNIPPQKPIKDQINDLFMSIKYYYKKDLELIKEDDTTKFKVKDFNKDKKFKLFEIYPFMGINTKNYTYSEVEEMLNKYFSDFNIEDTLEERRAKLYTKMGEFSGDLENSDECKNIFAGIKLYPPLGFEPWPQNDKELKKVELLYRTCVDKNIPVTVHCGAGGFDVDKKGKEFTDPGNQWPKVLKRYPGLKINFAHFGLGSKKWEKKIIEHIEKDESRVYSDISYSSIKDSNYKNINKLINRNRGSKLCDRLLFGSDFLINLFHLGSYNEYLRYFSDTNYLNDGVKYNLAEKNSEEFLFG